MVLPPAVSGQRSAAKLLAAFTALAGLLTLLALLPGVHSGIGIVGQAVPATDRRRRQHPASVIIGFGLLLVAHGLWRRKRVAWQLGVILLTAATVAHILKGPSPIAAVISGAMLIALIWGTEGVHRALGSAVALRGRLVRSGLPAPRPDLRLQRASRRERAHRARPDVPRRARDHLRRPRRASAARTPTPRGS